MPQLVLSRNFTLATKRGHMITFKKGQPTWVPPSCVHDAAAIGAEDINGKVDPLGAEAGVVIPLSAAERNGQINAALSKLVARNEREDFTGSGAPNRAVLNNMLGFRVDKKELETLWGAHRIAKGSE